MLNVADSLILVLSLDVMWNYLKGFLSKEDGDEKIPSGNCENEEKSENELLVHLQNPGEEESDPLKAENVSESFDKFKVGVVTSLEASTGLIDDLYSFSLGPSNNSSISTNDKVKFVAYQCESELRVSHFKKISDSEFDSANNEAKLKANSDSHLNDTYAGRIINRDKRMFEVLVEENKKFTFDISDVKANFFPYVGDFVELDVTSGASEETSDDNLSSSGVIRVRPLKTTVTVGLVSSIDDKGGVINKFATFSLNVCETGFNPGIGKKVHASVIRSDCMNGYKWRAIQVIPYSDQSGKSLIAIKRLEDEYRNKKGIFIPLSEKFTLKQNEEVQFKIEVTNHSPCDKYVKVHPVALSDHNQVILEDPKSSMVIKSRKNLCFNFKIIGKFIGKSHEDFIWDFGDFIIRRKFVFDVMCEEDLLPAANCDYFFDNHFEKHISSEHVIDKNEGKMLRAERLKAKNSKSRTHVKIGKYPVPKHLIEMVLPKEKANFNELRKKVEEHFPSLQSGLTPKTYREYMHLLLFLEEIQHLARLSLFDIENASFRKSGDFLILDVPEHSCYTDMLLPGDCLLASKLGDPEKQKMQGVIHRITRTELWIKFASSFHSKYKEGTSYFVGFMCSRMFIRRRHAAVDEAVKFLGSDWLFPSSVPNNPPLVVVEQPAIEIVSESKTSSYQNKNSPNEEDIVTKYLGRGKMLRERISNGSAFGRGLFREAPNKINAEKVSTKLFNSCLNEEQNQAVKNALCGVTRPLPFVIFGPPGTGKTVTLVETILQVHKHFPNNHILVCTPTNAAADLLAVRLVETGKLLEGDILRLVGMVYVDQGRLTASLVPYAATPSINYVVENKSILKAFDREQISQHKIVVSTLSCSSHLYTMGFQRGFFSHIFIDEAGQAAEPDILLPLTLLDPKSGCVILSGDPLQLGPIILSKLANYYGLGNSFLCRILSKFPYKNDSPGIANNLGYDSRLVTKLINNYRSLDAILRVFSSLFYEGHLVAKLSSETSEEAHFLSSLKSINVSCPVIFHGLRGTCRQDRDSKSFYNPQELFQTFSYLCKLYLDGVSPEQIGVVTPYKLHADKIREYLESNLFEAPKIGSVEEFQGQERMVIILNIVRSSDDPDTIFSTPFVTDPRRVNVAISRAQALLIIIGDPEFLDVNDIWHKILKYCVANGSYIGCQLPVRLLNYTPK